MADTLASIKKRLNIDQRNLSTGTVVSINSSTANVRLRDGSQRKAYLPAGVSVAAGDLVSVAIDGNLVSLQGAATLQALAAEKTVIL